MPMAPLVCLAFLATGAIFAPIVAWILSVWVLPWPIRKREHLLGSAFIGALMATVFMAAAAVALWGAMRVNGLLEMACWIVCGGCILFACLPAFFSVKVYIRLVRENTRPSGYR